MDQVQDISNLEGKGVHVDISTHGQERVDEQNSMLIFSFANMFLFLNRFTCHTAYQNKQVAVARECCYK